jgi:hypothetical protein
MPPGTRNALVPPSPNYLADAGQFVGGVGRGLGTQFVTSPLQLMQQSYQDPYALGQGVVMGLQELAADPAGVVKNSLRSMWNRAKSSPAGLGEVVGENIDPRNLLKPRKAVMAEMAKEIPKMPYDRAKRLLTEYEQQYLNGDIEFDDYVDKTKPLRQTVVEHEFHQRDRETKGKPLPAFKEMMHIPEGTRVQVRQREFPYTGTENGVVVGTHVLQIKGHGLVRAPIVQYPDGRTRRLTPSDVTEVFAPRGIVPK